MATEGATFARWLADSAVPEAALTDAQSNLNRALTAEVDADTNRWRGHLRVGVSEVGGFWRVRP